LRKSDDAAFFIQDISESENVVVNQQEKVLNADGQESLNRGAFGVHYDMIGNKSKAVACEAE
jgi:hypothetical protein